MELESKWNYFIKCKQKKRIIKKLRDEIFTWTMNLPHCLTQKCQKLSQLQSSWTPTLEATVEKNHQQQIRAYRLSASPRDFAPMHWWQREMC